MTYSPGDPGHIDVHNDLVTEVGDLASAFAVDVTLPPVRVLGDSGHVDDHNLFTAAIQKIADEARAPVAAVSGGTVTEYTGDGSNGVAGQRYRVHEFTGNGDLIVTTPGYAELLVCGGGSTGHWTGGESAGGGGGGVRWGTFWLPVGTIPAKVGGANVGSSLGPDILFAGRGGGNYEAIGGGGGSGYLSPGGTAGGAGANMVPPYTENWRGVTRSITGVPVEYGRGGSPGAAATLPGMGGGNSGQVGAAGRVIVRVELPPTAKMYDEFDPTQVGPFYSAARVDNGIVTELVGQGNAAWFAANPGLVTYDPLDRGNFPHVGLGYDPNTGRFEQPQTAAPLPTEGETDE